MKDVASIDPITLRDFLRSNGWQVVPEGVDHRLFIMRNKAFDRRELSFPMDTDVSDYSDTVNTAIRKFAELSDRSYSEVINSVKAVYNDVIQLRIFSANDRIEIPLSFAADFVRSAEKLLRSAACSVVRPRRYHPRLSLNEANQFVDTAKFGQTGEGSFIFRIECPVNAMDIQTSLELSADDAPFVRKVTSSLLSSIQLLTVSIELDALDAVVEEMKASEQPILSANMCDALCEMHETGLDNSIDVTVDWSPTTKTNSERLKPGRARLKREYFKIIEEVGRELRSDDEVEHSKFIATVERLDGSIGEDGRRYGPVLLSAFMTDGQLLKLSAFLPADQYELASRVHMKTDQYVLLSGSIRPGRQPRQLIDIQSFELVGNVFG
jgi:hypothetical protein